MMSRPVPLHITYADDLYSYALRYMVPAEIEKEYQYATRQGPNLFVLSGQQAIKQIEDHGGILSGDNAYVKSKLVQDKSNKKTPRKIFEADYDKRGRHETYGEGRSHFLDIR